jgi:uncharacterized protein (TIGR00251 family)
MIAVADHVEGCVVRVRAQPGARNAGVLGEWHGALRLAVTAPPEDGRANRALVELLAELLGVKRSQVEVIGGLMGRDKRFLIRGAAKGELEKRVAALGVG